MSLEEVSVRARTDEYEFTGFLVDCVDEYLAEGGVAVATAFVLALQRVVSVRRIE